jgi:hypothetical protein
MNLNRIKCFLGKHNWNLEKKTPVKINRTCRFCDRKEHSSYDMSWGETIWLNGHYW